jgi:two-component system, OmpR family, sensor histidine kinase KdpD
LGDSVPPGTGLGLTICRGFLQSMNGTISVSAGARGRGAIFSIRLNRA